MTPPFIEAHRGNSRHAPENTMAAFRSAAAAGVRWIELDVHETADGRLAVIHDRRLGRTTDATGDVSVLPWEVVCRADAGVRFGEPFRGESVPLLDTVVAWADEADIMLNVEVKSLHEDGTGLRALCRLLRGREYVLSSFNAGYLEALRDADGGAALALLGSDEATVQEALELGVEWVHLSRQAATGKAVAAAREAGLRVMVWTEDDPGAYGHWASMGVRRVCTNDPVALLAAQREATGDEQRPDQ